MRTIWWAAGIAAALLVVLAGTLPVWLPWAARPVARAHGFEFGRFERLSYARWVIHDARFAQPGWAARAARVEARLGRAREVTITDWELQLLAEPATPRAAAPGSTFDVLETVAAKMPALLRWLPTAHAVNGLIAADARTFRVPVVAWANGQLAATIESPAHEQTLTLTANLAAVGAYRLSAQLEPLAARAETELIRQPESWQAGSVVTWRGNELTLTQEFARASGWWPARAVVSAEQFTVPARLLDQTRSGNLTGAVFGRWADGAFVVELSAVADTQPDWTLTARAQGDFTGALIESLRLSGPGVQVELSEDARVQWRPPFVTHPARLRVAADLARGPWTNWAGQVTGKLQTRATDVATPALEFELAGADVTGPGVAISRGAARGRLEWPALIVDQAELTWPDGATLVASGTAEGPTFAVAAVAAEYRRGAATVTATGCVDRVAAQATIAALALTHAAELIGELAGPATVTFGGGRAGVTALRFTGPGGDFELDADVAWPRRGRLTTRWREAPLARWQAWTTALVGARQAERGSDIPVAIGNQHPAGRDRNVAPTDIFTGDLTELTLTAEWDAGPVVFALRARGALIAEGQPFSLAADVTGDADGIRVDNLTVTGAGGAVVTVAGTLPVALTPARWPAGWQILEEREIDLRAAAVADPQLWKRLGELTGLELVAPQAQITIGGTAAAPGGRIQATAQAVEWRGAQPSWALPRVETVTLDAELRPDGLRVTKLGLAVEGQPVRLSGEWPLAPGFWPALLTRRAWPDWRQATARLEITEANIAPFTHYLPAVLTPEGNLSVDLTFQPGGNLAGELTLTNAATRPLPPLGPIRNIGARVRFSEQTALIETFTGELGGEAVTLTGKIGLPADGGVEWDLRLRGTNVPLARQPGLVLRSDLDLRLAHLAGAPATLTGDMRLRNSLFLQDLQALLPGGLAEPRRRPPWFSVDDPLWAAWQLDVRIRGDQFLRVRSPLFRGEASAAFRLRGTLAEPVAVGEARLNSGLIYFPFGSLRVAQGFASLSPENPHRPQLFITATGRSFGYDLRVDVSGYADAPLVTFTSMPPLSSEEIVLMLTAGQVPRHEFGFTTQQKASRLAVYFARDLLTRMGFGEDAAERLEIRSGESITEQGDLTYYLEYRLTDRWSVIGEYDRFNALNAGLKWRIYSR